MKCECDKHIFAGDSDEAVMDFDSEGGDYIPSIDADLINYGGDAGLGELKNHDSAKQEIGKRVPPLRLFVGGCVFVGVFLVFVYFLRKAYYPLKWSIVDLWWPEWFCLYPASGL